jgi:copper chaperone CopZ
MLKITKTQIAIFTIAILAIFAITGVTTQIKADEKNKQDKTTISCKIKADVQSFYDKDMIERELKNHEGVSSAFVDLDEKIAYVDYDKTKTNPEKICNLIKNLGFEAKVIKEAEKDYGKK